MSYVRSLLIGIVLLLVFTFYGCSPTSFVITPVSGRLDLEETQILRDEGFWITDKIAVIGVDGILANQSKRGLLQSGENPVSLFLEKLDRAKRDENVKAVVLRLNSPGGTVGASDLMYHALMEFRKTTGKPVIASMLDVAASGAYYLACGCDGIIAQPTTVTGSIGTIFQTVNFAGTMKLLGINAEAIKSGELKDMASPLHPLRAKEREVLQALIMYYYENFLDVILKGREGLGRDKLRKLADGRVYNAVEAQQAGLVDKIGYPTDAITWAKKLARVNKVKVVMYHRSFGYKPNIYAAAPQKSDTGALVNIELPAWLQSQSPQFLYLWQVGDLSSN